MFELKEYPRLDAFAATVIIGKEFAKTAPLMLPDDTKAGLFAAGL